MGRKIPDRWINYKAMGKLIDNTPFVPFKVPLHDTICEKLPEYERHTTREIIEALPDLGMVIDLTNTPNRKKYYQTHDWESNGIDYQWIKCKGHVTPSEKVLVRFCQTVRKFMNKNPTKLIGIHCTHGLNRTGYFVCSYMVLVLQIPPHIALQTFAEARGYNIERQNYINSINSHSTNNHLRTRLLMPQQSRLNDFPDEIERGMPDPEIITCDIASDFHSRDRNHQSELSWRSDVQQGHHRSSRYNSSNDYSSWRSRSHRGGRRQYENSHNS